MNPYKNISVLRDQVDMDKKYLQQENDRLQHLTTVLIDHIWKKQPFPLKEIDRQMKLFDDTHACEQTYDESAGCA